MQTYIKAKANAAGVSGTNEEKLKLQCGMQNLQNTLNRESRYLRGQWLSQHSICKF